MAREPATTAKIGIDDIVAAAGEGALRAMSARGGGGTSQQLSVERLVASGFTVKFEIWAGGPFGPQGPLQGGLNQGGLKLPGQ